MSAVSPRFLLNATAMLGVGLAQRGVGLVLIVVLSRLLGPSGLGTFTFVQSTSNTFAGMSRLGLDAGAHVTLAGLKLPEEKARAEAVLGEGLTLFLLLSAGTALGMVLFANLIASGLFGAPELGPFVITSAALVLSQMLAQYCYTAFAGLQAFQRYSRIIVITSLLTAVAALVGAVLYGPWGCAVGFVLGQVLNLVLLARGLGVETYARGLTMRLRRPSREAYNLLKIGFPFYLSGFLLIPTEFVSLGLLSHSAGIDSLGELRVIQSLIALASIVPAALAGPMTSHLAAAAVGDKDAEPMLAQLKFNWMVSLLLVVSLGAIWPIAIDVIFGATYVEARRIGSLALVVFVPTMLTGVLISALLIQRRSIVLVLAGALQAGSFAMLAWLLIPRFGLGGLLTAQAIGFLVSAGALGIALFRHYGVSMARPWMVVLALLTALIISSLVISITHEPPLALRLAIAGGELIAIFVTSFASLAPPEHRRLASLGRQGAARIRSTCGRLLSRGKGAAS